MKNKVSKIILTVLFTGFIFGFALLYIVLPKQERSENEKRVLSKFPEVTFENLASGQLTEDFETFLADHVPFRDFFVGLNSYVNVLTGRNGQNDVYKSADGYLITGPVKFDEERTAANMKYLADFAEQTEIPATVMIVPEAGFVLGDKLPKNHNQYFDAEILKTAEENCGLMKYIDLSEVFTAEKDNMQIYYRTDHHVTSDGAMLMYKAFSEANGKTPSEFIIKERTDGFYGTTYSKSGLWLTKPDVIDVYKEKEESSYTVTIQEGEEENTYDSLYFPSHYENMDKYPVFLDGNHALVTIKNNDNPNGKKLLVIKDSYAHCLTTFLAADYEEITMVDMRYYRNSVSELAKEKGCNELLVVYGAENLASSTDIVWLSMF